MTDRPVLECRAVDAGYRVAEEDPPSVVLRAVNFCIGRGERLVVLGRSGSGKSTLLRLLNRFEDPLAGEVWFDGKPLPDCDALLLRRRVGLLLQTPVVFEGSVAENLGKCPTGVAPPSRSTLEKLLADVDLDVGLLERRALDLSVGEKQRVALARALVLEPEVLLLDEPASALDPRTTGRIAALVDKLNARGLTVVLATHQPDLVRRLPGRVMLIDQGKVVPQADEAIVSRFLEGSGA